MTVCIAAVCDLVADKEPKIVLCTDGKGSGPLGSKEYVLKDRWLSTRWRCLTAGGDHDLNALISLLRHRLLEMSVVDETNIQGALRKALTDRKLQRSDEFTQGRYGMTYAEFLRDGKATLPEDQFRSDMFSISQIVLDVDCIIAGFLDDGFPILLKIDGSGRAYIEEEFCVAGEGGYLAQSGLIHRQHSDIYGLERTLYCVYEAKCYAERVSSVNDWTHIAVFHRDGRFELLQPEGKAYFKKQYAKYAPQSFGNNQFAIEPSFFQEPS